LNFRRGGGFSHRRFGAAFFAAKIFAPSRHGFGVAEEKRQRET
jgi:hypothetical protein